MRTRTTYRLTLLLFLLMGSLHLFAQDCYTKARNNGIAAYNKGEYSEALKHFDFALNVCDEIPTDNDIAEWIQKCNLQSILQSINEDMVYVEGGTFIMGKEDYEYKYEPDHQVTVSGFYINRYEVTQKQWVAVMGSNPSQFKGDNLPVENVSWISAKQFITKINQLTGKRYRLPTDAEWEFAARGGNRSKGYVYAGSNDIESVAWFSGSCSSLGVQPVGTKLANELGLYDMSGNVSEWCSDWYGKYSTEALTNPKGPSTGDRRVLRGGCWSNSIPPGHLRVAHRESYPPGYCDNQFGFRLCL